MGTALHKFGLRTRDGRPWGQTQEDQFGSWTESHFIANPGLASIDINDDSHEGRKKYCVQEDQSRF
jgi:hypothetical protein